MILYIIKLDKYKNRQPLPPKIEMISQLLTNQCEKLEKY